MDVILRIELDDNAKPDEIDYALRLSARHAGDMILNRQVASDGRRVDLPVGNTRMKQAHIRVLLGE